MLEKKKTAVVTLTRGGQKLARQIKEEKEVDIFSPEKFENDKAEIYYYHSSLKKLTANLFNKYDNIIYIMALGIVVRIIAPYLEDKRVDPAVVTIDESGQHVISTISGHLGGANELTKELAQILDANAVITTATDCQGKIAIDILAKRMNCIIEPFQNLKMANAAIVNGQALNIFTEYNLNLAESDNISIYPFALLNSKTVKEAFPVIISNKKVDIEGDYLQLIPHNIIVGIGCRRGITVDKIKAAVEGALDDLNLKEKSIKNLATIDLKKDEVGLLAFAKEKSLKLDIIDRKKIKEADLDISRSDFVEKTIGVPGVCEPAALLSSSRGKLILNKRKYDKVTVAVVEEDVNYE